MFFDENDTLFGGSVEDKFFDVIHNASPTLVRKEIANLVLKLVKCEKILDTHGIKIDDNDQEGLEDLINDSYINMMGNILSNNE